MNYQNIVLAPGPVSRLTLNRPDQRNALSLQMMDELIDALGLVAKDPEARVVVVDGAGPVFSAGHNLRELVGRDVGGYREIFDRCCVLMEAVQAIPQPVIAAVRGLATAAGCQLVAACDLVVAAEGARFATPGVKIGLFCSTPMVALTRAIGRKRAMEMLLTGEPIDAATAAEWGLVNRVVGEGELDRVVLELAERIRGASGATVAIGKQAFYAQIDLEQPKAYAYTKEVMSLNALAPDAQEGMTAFLEKRPPRWTRRDGGVEG